MKFTYKKIEVEKIKPDPTNPNKHRDNDEKIKGIAQTMKFCGLIKPIEVDENYMIITGEARWRAAKLAGLSEIDCKVISGMDKRKILLRRIAENIHSHPLIPLDTASGLLKLLKITHNKIYPPNEQVKFPVYDYEKKKWNKIAVSMLAEKIGKSEGYILKHVDILKFHGPRLKNIIDNID